MLRLQMLWIWGGLLCLVTACASFPGRERVPPSPGAELRAHVDFLCQSKFRGRAPRSSGSRESRQYIERKFKEYGLVPWPGCNGFEQSFGYGKNLIAVLPGTDPDPEAGFVLFSAHYDHLAAAHGKAHPGAADNAAGVAALLETARQFATGPLPKTRRSIVFAAFDCEEMFLFGSFAFTCREDVRQSRIAAVVNVDILGRAFLDVLEKTVFVTGTERFPSLRRDIQQFGNEAGLRMLPVGTDVIGPRSDHVAFEARGVPCLFFSSGLYRDYHKPTDTPEKLNYSDLERSTQVLVRTVGALARTREIPPPVPAASGHREELQTLRTVLSELNARAQDAGLGPRETERVQRLAVESSALLESRHYDRTTRERLILGAGAALNSFLFPLPSSATPGDSAAQAQQTAFAQLLQYFYLRYGPEILEGYRELVSRVLLYRPGVFRRMPEFQHEICGVEDEDVEVKLRPDGRVFVKALVHHWKLSAGFERGRRLLPSPFQIQIETRLELLRCEGTREQAEDYCLLRLRREQANPVQFAALAKVVAAVWEAPGPVSYPGLLQRRLDHFSDEVDWLVHGISSPLPEIAVEAIQACADMRDPKIQSALAALLTNSKVRSDVRAAAIAAARSPDLLLTLCGLLEDRTAVLAHDEAPLLAKYFPSVESIMADLRPILRKLEAKSPDTQTLGALAYAQLKTVTGKDFGRAPERWRRWLTRSHA